MLTTPNATRWNSLSDAMVDLQKVKSKLNEVMIALDLRQFTSEEFLFLDEYVRLTRPLAICLDKLQGNDASLGLVLPAIVSLQKFFKDRISDGKLKLCEVMAKFLLWDLSKRTDEYFEDKDFILGKF